MTNGEKIRSMTNEELADFLCRFDACVLCPESTRRICNHGDCDEIGLTEEWLNQETKRN